MITLIKDFVSLLIIFLAGSALWSEVYRADRHKYDQTTNRGAAWFAVAVFALAVWHIMGRAAA